MNLKSSLVALLVIAIWGSNFTVIKSALTEIPPLAFLTLRFWITGLLFLPFVKWPDTKTIQKLFSVGFLIGILHQGFMFAGLTMVGAGTMSILLQSQIVIVTLIGWLFLKEAIGWRTWTGIAMGISGVAILMGGADLNGHLTGYIFGILSALFIALAYIQMRTLKVSPATFIVFINLTVAPIMLGMSFFFEGHNWVWTLPQVNWMVLGPALAFQVLALSTSHMLWQRLLASHPVSQVVPWCLLIPVFGVAGGVLALGEPLTASILIGGLMTVLGVGIVTFRKIQKGAPPKVEAFD